jgi:tRNA(Ile)-lysidine synthase TilS/MesJ
MAYFADSTVLAYVMKTLNKRYQYGLELFLLSIDEGITGYRDDSLEVFSFSLVFEAIQNCDPPDRKAKSFTIRNASQDPFL